VPVLEAKQEMMAEGGESRDDITDSMEASEVTSHCLTVVFGFDRYSEYCGESAFSIDRTNATVLYPCRAAVVFVI